MKNRFMNERAWAIAEDCVTRADALQIGVSRLPNGTRVIDAGVEVPGSLTAGLQVARMCLGGLGQVELGPVTIEHQRWEAVHVRTDHPALACMASQYAGWAINPDGYFAMGSGPLRAAARVERTLFDKLEYAEVATNGVLVLEGRTLPGVAVATWIAEQSHVPPTALTLVIAPTASLAGTVQIVARSVETGLHKLDTLGFDVRRVVKASGRAPLPPPSANDLAAIGHTNDCVLYGGQVRYFVEASDSELETLATQLPSTTSPDYGRPFYDIFMQHGKDFYAIDPLLFSPAEVWLTSAFSGRTFHAGRVNTAVLRASLFAD